MSRILVNLIYIRFVSGRLIEADHLVFIGISFTNKYFEKKDKLTILRAGTPLYIDKSIGI
ncbi:hypothetical protein KL86DYS1_30447 [uncultured Dysgonomonas sp.]|uniref:Uncharacterized protein n=1 Tax=uncultured Dysgonomonas sp. TaxID=206096 RepID=A0A212JU39_9BACT|nr:hypothetical protein KL86DYS1_30447 [uncultured Dysgonomonas sp.]